jgi:hypothetical protein
MPGVPSPLRIAPNVLITLSNKYLLDGGRGFSPRLALRSGVLSLGPQGRPGEDSLG